MAIALEKDPARTIEVSAARISDVCSQNKHQHFRQHNDMSSPPHYVVQSSTSTEAPGLARIGMQASSKYFFSGLRPESTPIRPHPYVSCLFPCPTPHTSAAALGDSEDSYVTQYPATNPMQNMLFDLGIVLIELCLKVPLESLRLAHKDACSGDPVIVPDNLNYLREVEELVEDVGREIGDGYGDAIQSCVKFYFRCSESSDASTCRNSAASSTRQWWPRFMQLVTKCQGGFSINETQSDD